MESTDWIFQVLSRSKFRSRFSLDEGDLAYIVKIGLEKVEFHARDFVAERLAPALPANDGRQTPFKGHPVFKAQHATATCCRGCLAKWHHIPKGVALSQTEQDNVVLLIMAWIMERLKDAKI